jgi:hypothetical protein
MNYAKQLKYLAKLENEYGPRGWDVFRWSTDDGKIEKKYEKQTGITVTGERNWYQATEPAYKSKPFVCAYCLGDLGQSIPDACPHCGHTMLEPSSAEAASRSPE